ncbi:hypothetical protein OAP14_09160, partial [Aliiglaciecola sp.]|nr:hypothetical protein [Aliiglaciecola sp.]
MKLISILLFSLILFGCKSTKNEPLAPVNIDYNQKFEELLGQFKADGNSVSYEEMWHVYLKSDQIQNSAVKQDDYLDILNQLESGQKNCDEIDWLFITSQNFWSIKPHISAATCYEMIGDGLKSNYHNSAVEFLLTGILSSGDGTNYYSAYEVATWGDASDFIELTDYEVV